ncbi:MAG: hypothetical protein ACR2JF_06525 [Iamia sp.]
MAEDLPRSDLRERRAGPVSRRPSDLPTPTGDIVVEGEPRRFAVGSDTGSA